MLADINPLQIILEHTNLVIILIVHTGSLLFMNMALLLQGIQLQRILLILTGEWVTLQ